MIANVTVYCASSHEVDEAFLRAARDVGRGVARRGWGLVYGGTNQGCMRELAEGAREAGGKVVGVVARYFVDHGAHDPDCDELVITPTMAERKTEMSRRGDALLALPGGIGTYEELFEQLVCRQLDMHRKPLVALNLAGAFEPMRKLLDDGIERRFIRPSCRGLLLFADAVDEALDTLTRPVKGRGTLSFEVPAEQAK
jgi:uncharacterized protein (TIGR00730 family)